MDHLPTPMSDAELIEILARNLRPEIRQDLLYVPIHSIAHLRKLVQMRENFLNDESVRKNLATRNQNTVFSRKYLSEIDSTEQIHNAAAEEIAGSVDAIGLSQTLPKCWNCDEVGHHWENCLEQRTIFCYGCGTKNVYKPNSVLCAGKKHQQPKNLRAIIGKQEKN